VCRLSELRETFGIYTSKSRAGDPGLKTDEPTSDSAKPAPGNLKRQSGDVQTRSRLFALSFWHREEVRCLAALVQPFPDDGADGPDQSECRNREIRHTTR
jgi:hypothetical protein